MSLHPPTDPTRIEAFRAARNATSLHDLIPIFASIHEEDVRIELANALEAWGSAVVEQVFTEFHFNLNDRVAPPWLPLVRRLELVQQRLRPDDLRWLLSLPALKALRSLNLYDNQLGDEGVAVLTQSPQHLRALDLGCNQLTDRSLRLLARSPKTRALRSLGLHWNQFSPEGLSDLARAPNLRPLQHLRLRLDALGAHGMRALTDRRALPSLQSFDFADQTHAHPSVLTLCASQLCTRIHTLTIEDSLLTNETAAHLIASLPRMKRLECLSLAGNPIDLEALRTWPKDAHPPALREILLTQTHLYANALDSLRELSHHAPITWWLDER